MKALVIIILAVVSLASCNSNSDKKVLPKVNKYGAVGQLGVNQWEMTGSSNDIFTYMKRDSIMIITMTSDSTANKIVLASNY